jgi:hypothetical protein
MDKNMKKGGGGLFIGTNTGTRENLKVAPTAHYYQVSGY